MQSTRIIQHATIMEETAPTLKSTGASKGGKKKNQTCMSPRGVRQ